MHVTMPSTNSESPGAHDSERGARNTCSVRKSVGSWADALNSADNEMNKAKGVFMSVCFKVFVILYL